MPWRLAKKLDERREEKLRVLKKVAAVSFTLVSTMQLAHQATKPSQDMWILGGSLVVTVLLFIVSRRLYLADVKQVVHKALENKCNEWLGPYTTDIRDALEEKLRELVQVHADRLEEARRARIAAESNKEVLAEIKEELHGEARPPKGDEG